MHCMLKLHIFFFIHNPPKLLYHHGQIETCRSFVRMYSKIYIILTCCELN